MKAIIYTKYGLPDELKLSEVEKPTPMANEVLIRVHAASINSWDWDLLTGTFQGRLGGFRIGRDRQPQQCQCASSPRPVPATRAWPGHRRPLATPSIS